MQLAQTGNREAAEREIQAVAAQAAQITMLREEELTLLERDALLAPDHAAIQGQIGLARYLGHWQKEAEAGLLNAALLEPRNPGNLYRLAIYYKDTGRVAEAIPVAERLLKLRPGDRQFEQFAAELKSPPVPTPPSNAPATGP